ncbi:putative Periostin [Hypsibius exemplaris]|uniref:Periostin n=1 Tax=Hypsibius exemplaris TaxID=2072580 RepID=A0A9X6NJ96_HYPEX|nr:putative Periostin [Hypsibius exemplaris]
MNIILLITLVASARYVATEEVVTDTGLDIVDLADRLGFYSYLLAADETNLTDTLRSASNITLFIPTNEAFLSLSQPTRDIWAADVKFYTRLMKYHVIKGAYMAADLLDEHLYDTLDNSLVRIDSYNSSQPTPFTDYANSRIIQSNFRATNGFIHVIKDVVLDIEDRTILDWVAENKNLSLFFNGTTIVPSVQALLNNAMAPFTLFVPTNKAIDSLPKGTWERLMRDPTSMTDVLNGHIVNETFYSNGLVKGDVLQTVNKLAKLTVGLQGDKLFINTAQVIQGNNGALNGVIHIVNQVLLPKISS